MKRLSAVESFTGGLFASKIVSKKGASKFFMGSIVAYDSAIKEKLGINIKNGVMSEKIALAMTKAGNEFFNSDICVSFTGNAGPKALEGKKAGEVFIAINSNSYHLFLTGNRNQIREKAVDFAINKIKNII